MLHKRVITVGLAVALLGLASMVVFAQPSDSPRSRGVVATITALDATEQPWQPCRPPEAGEVFALPQESQWHVGHKVIHDRIDAVRPPAGALSDFGSRHMEVGDAAAQAGSSPHTSK